MSADDSTNHVAPSSLSLKHDWVVALAEEGSVSYFAGFYPCARCGKPAPRALWIAGWDEVCPGHKSVLSPAERRAFAERAAARDQLLPNYMAAMPVWIISDNPAAVMPFEIKPGQIIALCPRPFSVRMVPNCGA